MCERRVAEYEEELSRTKEKNERRHRLEAVLEKHQVVLHRPDVQQLIGRQEEGLPQPPGRRFTLKQEAPQPPYYIEEEEEAQAPHIKKEEEELWITQEEACLLGQGEADLTKFPLTVVSVKTEDHEEKPPESSQLHHSPNVQQLIGYQEEPLLQLKEEPQPPHIKEEEEELWITQEEERLLGQEEADLTKFPLTVVSVKTEDHEVDHLIAPLSSDSDDASHDNVNMESHMRTQTRQKPFNCSVCGKTLSKKSVLRIHMKIHTGETPYSCSVCAKRFVRNADLTRHMRTHTGEKPFNCSKCGKTFSQSGTMRSHMRTHTGEKLFSCPVCAKSFFRNFCLTKHMRTHAGEKPFSCSVCGNRFSNKSNMQRHMRTH
ncbi:zinc finger protein 771-like isoform X12 [Entelurus aequoreus]|uniref:zinc finger protein 771-like isoform X12 n=1 Tax=Entelurus aequoreus TaxID=161455 RepID=UPI002B1CFD88|nr:zinc finger protein 771-like isoform X12 [Entelurus aequoreus]